MSLPRRLSTANFHLIGAVFTLMIAQGTPAAAEKVMEIDYSSNSGGFFVGCLLGGGHSSETASTVSCTTSEGQTTTCDKNVKKGEPDCATMVEERGTRPTKTRDHRSRSTLNIGTVSRIAN